jgi:anti-anti-sigma factor
MAHERPSQFRIRHDQGCTIITASGPEIEFDSKDELYALAEMSGPDPRHVVLNLQHVVSFKSAILGVLIQFQRKVEQAGARLKVVCPDPDILTMFRITKVDLVLDLQEGEQIAIDAFCGSTRSSAVTV